MAAQSGLEFVLKIGDGGGPENFTVVGGFRSNTLGGNVETIDTTNKDSAEIRQLLPGKGTKAFSASGSGVFVDDAGFAAAHTAFENKTADNWEILIPDFGTYTGPFMIPSLEFGGEHNGELTYSISLESAGTIVFATI